MNHNRNRSGIHTGESARFVFPFILSLCLMGLALVPLPGKADLVKEQQTIRKQYPGVTHISADQLQDALVGDEAETVLFDVRERAEYAVSHIEGAIQVDPDMSGEEFLARYGDRIGNRKVVFYCSVGYRSSHMAELLRNQSPADPPTDVLNLRHGLFGWHNEKRNLVRGDSPTDLIHPYNFWWGRLLERRNLTSYRPR